MQRIPIDLAAPGMTLAKAVENEKGQTLVAKGAELTQPLIDRLKRFNIATLTVEGSPVALPGATGPPSPEKIRAETEAAFARAGDDPDMARLREMILRHRLAHAEKLLAEQRGGAAPPAPPEAGKPGGPDAG